MPTPSYTSYPWMISFDDLEDELILKKGMTYLTTHPSPDNNYFNLTAAKFISFVNSKNIDVSVLNGLTVDQTQPNHIHYLCREWLIKCLQMLVCGNNIGLNNVADGIQNDVYYFNHKRYSSELVSVQSQITYETIVTGTLQMNQTRAGNTFRIQY